MLTRHTFGRFGKSLGLVLMIGAMGAAYAARAFAQADAPAQLPNGPAKPGFDIARFSSTEVCII